MTIVGIDDTDSQTEGMCTTYIGHRIAETLRCKHNTTAETYLIRLNPAAKHKTRGNAAVAIHTTAAKQTAFNIAKRLVEKYSHPEDKETNPGVVCIDADPNATTPLTTELGAFTERALTEFIDISTAERIITEHDLTAFALGNGRGRIGSLAAIGAHTTFTDWTFEAITYRTESNWGETRTVDWTAIETTHNNLYPRIWDNYDPVTGHGVCVPNTPCPVLFGIRGDDTHAVETAAAHIANSADTERTTGTETFKSNQGTDVQFSETCISNVTEDTSVILTGRVAEPPETIEGGHVFTAITCQSRECDCNTDIDVVAFEPTKRFRGVVRRLREGDEVTVYGEVTDGTVKLEKLVVAELETTTKTNPYCDACEKSMSSMGADQGYRCSSCRATTPKKTDTPLHRDLVTGKAYEVPPSSRRHLTQPLVRNP